MRPTISLILTIHNRSAETTKKVADSLRLPGNKPDELIVVLDRPTREAADAAAMYSECAPVIQWPSITGESSWLCPARAWNVGFKAATSDFVYCISSETVQAEGNVERARALIADGRTILHGKAECSCGPQGQEVNWGGMAPGNLLCDAKHPRPLGFIWAGPRALVEKIGGYDEAFMDGLWFDDNDFFLRLWNTGADFLFDDSVSGIHLHHERPGLSTPDGQAKIARNQALMLKKHGVLHPWNMVPKMVEYGTGVTRWRHT